MVLLQLCAIAGVLLQFWCNLHLRLGASCCDLKRLKISNAYRYWPGAGWKCDRAPTMTNQAGKNTRRKDAWRKLAQWPGRSDLAVSRFPIVQHRLSHALNIPFLKGIVNGFFKGWRGNWHDTEWEEWEVEGQKDGHGRTLGRVPWHIPPDIVVGVYGGEALWVSGWRHPGRGREKVGWMML
jgi:hypothetical protein